MPNSVTYAALRWAIEIADGDAKTYADMANDVFGVVKGYDFYARLAVERAAYAEELKGVLRELTKPVPF